MESVQAFRKDKYKPRNSVEGSSVNQFCENRLPPLYVGWKIVVMNLPGSIQHHNTLSGVSFCRDAKARVMTKL